jgi:hypothetical protein
MVNSVFGGIDVVIANGKKSELSRLRRKIEISGGIVRLNFSKAVRYYVVPYGKQTGSKWKDGQAKIFGLEPLDERFVDACIHYKQLLPHLPFRARVINSTGPMTHQFIMYNPSEDFIEPVNRSDFRSMDDDSYDLDSETTLSVTSPRRRKRYYHDDDSYDSVDSDSSAGDYELGFSEEDSEAVDILLDFWHTSHPTDSAHPIESSVNSE